MSMEEKYTIALRKTEKKKIYVDPQGREGFYLYPGEVRELKLKDGNLYTEEELEQMRLVYAAPRARRRALAVLARGDKTERELEEKLESSLNDSRSLAEAMANMKSCGYVDDMQYARDYIYFKRNRKSFLQIKMELKRKGIPSETIELAFEEEGGQKKEDLLPMLEKYARKFPELDFHARQKIYTHFARKGYAGDLIREGLDEMASGEEETDFGISNME